MRFDNTEDSLSWGESRTKDALRAIAFYLPQFHPIPENDDWWGRGFTEWRNVTKANPLFPGHYQPHLPADLGFYDLRVPEVREDQARMAREHGIHGFCYYHYWFNGKRLLQRPFDEVLASGRPDLPFCLCWANENWTRVWDGEDRYVLMEQRYSSEDDIAHIRSLLPAFHDPRYIRVDNRPLFLVYRAEALPDPAATLSRWRTEVRKAGLPGIYLARVENYESAVAGTDPRGLGFDAEVEFPPFSWPIGCALGLGWLSRWMRAVGLQPKAYGEHLVIPYEAMMRGMLNRPEPAWTRFPGVTPSWDNSARRAMRARIFPGSTPKLYGDWLTKVARQTLRKAASSERIVFINAWNEWAEGNHLEPDLKWGLAYLKATKEALERARALGAASIPGARAASAPSDIGKLKRLYWRTAASLKQRTERRSQT